MKTLKKNYDAIVEYLNEECSKEELIYLHNTMCDEYNYFDNQIFVHDEEFYNTFFADRPDEAVRAAFYGEIRWCDEYIKFNGYGNLETFNDPTEEIDETLIAECILERPGSFDIQLEEEEEYEK